MLDHSDVISHHQVRICVVGDLNLLPADVRYVPFVFCAHCTFAVVVFCLFVCLFVCLKLRVGIEFRESKTGKLWTG